MDYRSRTIERRVEALFEVFPVVTITGPRQSGKSTFLKNYAERSSSQWHYFNLDDRTLLLRIQEDPQLFVKELSASTIIDEAQKAPELFHSIKYIVDAGFPHKIILSGSANFLLMKSVTESLAGRVGILEMLPFSIAEALSLEPSNFLKHCLEADSIESLHAKLAPIKPIADETLLDFILMGGFPKLHYLSSPEAKIDWFQSYISTYIEKDLRDFAQITDLNSFQQTYQILAYQIASLINVSNLSDDLGLSHGTISKYISILETSYQFKKLHPFSINPKKKLIKSPKIMSYDSGLINFLVKNFDKDRMMHSGYWGRILETWVFSELYKTIKDMVIKPSLSFYRTRNESEIDFVIELGDKLIPIEVKSGSQVKSQSLKSFYGFFEDYSERFNIPFGIVLHRGERPCFLSKQILGVPINLLY